MVLNRPRHTVIFGMFGVFIAWQQAVSSELKSAQDAAEKVEEMAEEVVVTGTRTPKTLLDSPVNIDVISGEQLEKVSQSTVGRALNFLPGVVAKRNQKDGYVVLLQGYSASRVLVLLNGLPLITPTGSEVDLDQISVANIERIEIMRGAGSVLYGSAAMGGVINIITSKEYSQSLSLSAQLASYVGNQIEDADYGWQYRVQGRGRAGKLFTQLSFQEISDPGFDYDPQEVVQDGITMEKQFTRGELGYEFSPLVLTYAGQWLNEDREKVIFSRRLPPTFAPTLFYYLSQVEQQQHSVSLRDNSAVANNPSWKASLRHSIHEELSGNMPTLRDATLTRTNFDSQKVWMAKQQEWVGGLSANGETMQQLLVQEGVAQGVVEIPDESRENYEAFLQYNRFGKGWDWLLGGRYQHDTRFDDHTALRLSGMKNLGGKGGEWRLRAGIGQSYRVPDLKEQYYFFDHSNLGYIILGNPELQPETAVSGNVSLSWHWLPRGYGGGGVNVEFNVHASQADNLIDTVLSNASAGEGVVNGDVPIDVFIYQNITKTETQGFDLNMDIAGGRWQWQVNYSYLQARDAISKQRLANRPRHQLKTNLSLALTEGFNVMFYALHERDEQAPAGLRIDKNATSTFNFNLDYQMLPTLRWQLGVDNIFDERRDTAQTQGAVFDIRPVASRNVFLGFTLELL